MRATIKDRKEIAKGTLMVKFDLHGQEIDFKPGQIFVIRLMDPPYNDARGPIRHFSFINSPNEKSIVRMTTRLRGSAFKKSLQELPLGTEVEIGPVAGNFTLPEDQSRPLVFAAGGIGITPFISMLRYINEESLNYKITLIYSNSDRASTPFLEELQNMAKKNPSFKLILTMTQDPEWEGEKRRVDAQFIKDHIPDPKAYTYLVSGPPPMVEAISRALSEVGVNESNIKKENFTGY